MGQTDYDSEGKDPYEATDPVTGNVWREYYTCPYCGAMLGEAELIDAIAEDGPIGCDTCGNSVIWGEANSEWGEDA